MDAITVIEDRICHFAFKHADELPSEFWKIFWRWYDAIQLKKEKTA